MKKQILLILLTIGLSPWAEAGSTVCASKTFYYSFNEVDQGIPPRPGQVVGHITILSHGEVLLNKDRLEGSYSPDSHYVDLQNLEKPFKTEGSKTAGSHIFKATAVLFDIAIPSVENTPPREISREEVLCTRTWAFVP